LQQQTNHEALIRFSKVNTRGGVAAISIHDDFRFQPS
jgi:hypothetical protein